MKTRKIFAVLFACAIITLSFSACGGSDTNTTESSEPETVAETTVENITEGKSTSSDETEAVSEEAVQTGSFTGTYSPKTIADSEGSEISYEEYVAQAALQQGFEEGTDEYNAFIASANAVYTFNGDGTVTAAVGGEEKEGTYEYDGAASLTTTFDGVITEYQYDSDANTLTATDTATGITVVMSQS